MDVLPIFSAELEHFCGPGVRIPHVQGKTQAAGGNEAAGGPGQEETSKWCQMMGKLISNPIPRSYISHPLNETMV